MLLEMKRKKKNNILLMMMAMFVMVVKNMKTIHNCQFRCPLNGNFSGTKRATGYPLVSKQPDI